MFAIEVRGTRATSQPLPRWEFPFLLWASQPVRIQVNTQCSVPNISTTFCTSMHIVMVTGGSVVPKIVKLPKPPAKAEKRCSDPKASQLAEIILFPNGKNEIPFINSSHDPEIETRWLHLADEALKRSRKA